MDAVCYVIAKLKYLQWLNTLLIVLCITMDSVKAISTSCKIMIGGLVVHILKLEYTGPIQKHAENALMNSVNHD